MLLGAKTTERVNIINKAALARQQRERFQAARGDGVITNYRQIGGRVGEDAQNRPVITSGCIFVMLIRLLTGHVPIFCVVYALSSLFTPRFDAF